MKEKNKIRTILVLIFLIVFFIVAYIAFKGSYLEYKELGENYLDIFWTNFKYRYYTMGINFIVIYVLMYFTNRGIKKGLKPFFEQEKKEMPKLINKSISLVIATIVSIIVANVLISEIILFKSDATFGITDPIFNFDISFYMFIKPLVEKLIYYAIFIVIGLSVYMMIYYVAVFNMFFDGIDKETLIKSKLIKKLERNIIIISVLIAGITLLNTTNIVFQKLLTIQDGVEIVGAGFIEATIKLWGYRIFALVIIVTGYRTIHHLKKVETKKVLKDLIVIPGYLVSLFIVIIMFNIIFINSSELDKEKQYIAYNIENTKNAFGININEEAIEYSGTITKQQTENNEQIINNVPIISENTVLSYLEDNQTSTGHYTYRSANLYKYKIDNNEHLAYMSIREIVNGGRTYSNKTYEYTHGYGAIFTSATTTNSTGNIEYIQKATANDVISISEPRIYYGLNTDSTIVTKANDKKEYDYTDDYGNEYTYEYNGTAGLNLNFIDRLILAMKKGNLKLALSSSVTDDSKILINRNIIERAKKALPYLLYDENPYTVVDSEGNIIWVLDAYTVSSSYPYSSYTTIEYNGNKQRINYIRNSVKVLINSYDGTMKFYITDRTDPIAMAYRNTYTKLFEDIEEEIPQDIAEHFIYPKFLYNIQSEVLNIYHNVKPDVLYRGDDIWQLSKYTLTQTTKNTGITLEPSYTLIKGDDNEYNVGLVQTYTQNNKQNIISYLVGTYNNIFGPMQLDKQIEQDETILNELESLNVTGTRTTKNMIIVPIENTLLYVEPIYQIMLNETNLPTLEKVVVASGNKLAIGDDIEEALKNLLSQSAVDIELDNTDNIEGLVEAIIKANNNLKESTSSKNWEMMGSDIQRLQELIDSLEVLKTEEDKNDEENKDNNSKIEIEDNSNNENEPDNELNNVYEDIM